MLKCLEGENTSMCEAIRQMVDEGIMLGEKRGEKQGSTETHALALTSPDGLKKRLLWRIPHAVHPNVTVNGTTVPAEIAYKCGFCELTAELRYAEGI